MGRPSSCNPCCPQASSAFSGSTTDGCGSCIDGIIAVRYFVPNPNVTSGTCSSGDCSLFNQDWTVRPGFGCFRVETGSNFSSCLFLGTGPATVGFNFTNTNINLSFSDGVTSAASYVKSITAPYDCLVPHTLSLTYDGGECSGWPSTITVSPI